MGTPETEEIMGVDAPATAGETGAVGQGVNLADLLGHLDDMADANAELVASGGQAQPLAQGTFSLYVTPESGLLLVTRVNDPASPLHGERAQELPARLIRAVTAFGSGGGMLNALGGLIGRGKHRRP